MAFWERIFHKHLGFNTHPYLRETTALHPNYMKLQPYLIKGIAMVDSAQEAIEKNRQGFRREHIHHRCRSRRTEGTRWQAGLKMKVERVQ